MKTQYASVLLSAALIGHASAEEVIEVVPVPAPVVPVAEPRVEEEVVVTPVPDGAVIDHGLNRRIDVVDARRRLGMVPQVIPPATPVPGDVVETIETTTTVETPGQPTRVYNVERQVVVVGGRELPYVTLPVLFVEGKDELLDKESRLAIEDTAKAIREVLITDPTAVFDVEGHTSTDGTDDFNLQLSADRARRIFGELTQNYEVPAASLSAHGYGEQYPTYPDGTEDQMVMDRRVLVVRSK